MTHFMALKGTTSSTEAVAIIGCLETLATTSFMPSVLKDFKAQKVDLIFSPVGLVTTDSSVMLQMIQFLVDLGTITFQVQREMEVREMTLCTEKVETMS